MEYSAQKQSGSTIVYVIVGVVLAAASVGAIIIAQHRGNNQQIASQPSTEMNQPSDEQSEGERESFDTSSKSEDEAQNESQRNEEKKREAEEKKKAEEAKKEEEAKQAEAQREKEEAAREQQEQATGGQQGPMARTGGEQPAAALPETGPVEDTLSMVVGIIAIMGAGYFYYHFGGRR